MFKISEWIALREEGREFESDPEPFGGAGRQERGEGVGSPVGGD